MPKPDQPTPATAFLTFAPRLLPVEQLRCEGFREDLLASRLLVIGEMHGVRENCDVLYSMCFHYGLRTLGLEIPVELAPLVASAATFEPDFSLIDEVWFVASVLSVEMAKTVAVLLDEGLVDQVVYLAAPAEDEEDRERVFAERILALPREVPSACILGNWHTVPMVVEHEGREHVSALVRVREARRATYVALRYLSGEYYNIGPGLASFGPTAVEGREYELRGAGAGNFEVVVPRGRAVWFEA